MTQQDGPQDSGYAAPPASPYAYPPGQAYPPQQGYAYPPQNQGYAYPPQQGYAYPPAYAPPNPELYAHWGKRVAAYLLDVLVALPGFAVALVGAIVIAATSDARGRATSPGFGIGMAVVLLGYALALALQIWNRWVRAGRTGQSWGKKIMGIRLVGQQDGRPIGVGMAFVRDLAHVLDAWSFYIGYLWPLWDAKRQTFADKVCSTVVLAH